MWDRFSHLPSCLYSLHTCARVAQRRFAHLSQVSARGRKSSRHRVGLCLPIFSAALTPPASEESGTGLGTSSMPSFLLLSTATVACRQAHGVVPPSCTSFGCLIEWSSMHSRGFLRSSTSIVSQRRMVVSPECKESSELARTLALDHRGRSVPFLLHPL